MILKLNHSDCIAQLASMEDNSVDLTITDIPYDCVNRASNGLRNLDKGDADPLNFDLTLFCNELYRVTKGSVYIFCSYHQTNEMRKVFEQLKCSIRYCIWEKTNPSPMNGQHIWLSSIESCMFIKKPGGTFNEHCKSAVWRDSVERSIKGHPTPKPVLLLKRLIEASSNEGDTVFDPCMGSGSTGLACKMTNRNFIGSDINKDYVDAAIERIETLDLEDNPWLRKLKKREN